jgi:multiple sugar transport system permease protein
VNRHRLEERFFGIARWVSIAFFLTIAVFPMVVMISLSFKPIATLVQDPGNILPSPGEFSTDTYERILASPAEGGYGFTQFIQNSAFISGATVVGVLILGVLAAYATTRLRYRGSRAINTAIILIYLFPPVVFAVPLFVFFTRLGMRPSFTAVIIIYFAYTLPLGMYMLQNYFRSIPLDLEDAARVDGASRLQVVRHIVTPLARPAIVTVGIYVFMAAWDEFLFALLFLLEDRESWTVALGINQLEAVGGTPATVLMAGCVVITVPVMVVFSFAQRFITEGLTTGATKE